MSSDLVMHSHLQPGSDSPELLFIAGTDTDVGKTHCAARIALAIRHCGLRVGVYKPVASGCRSVSVGSGELHSDLIADDAVQLWNAAGRPLTLGAVCPQRFRAAVAPNAAARLDGTAVEAGLLRSGADVWIAADFDVVIVEGAGGLFSPLADGVLNADLVNQFAGIRVLLVANNKLGVIHQAVATTLAARHAEIDIAGVLLNQVDDSDDPSRDSNAAQLDACFTSLHVDTRVIGSMPFASHVPARQDAAQRDIVDAESGKLPPVTESEHQLAARLLDAARKSRSISV